MKVFMITPHHTDPDFLAKQAFVEQMAPRSGIVPLYALPSAEGFDIVGSIQLLKSADFCIADLSLERPSCYFETGYAQSMDKSVELVAQRGTPIHQVLGRQYVQFYNGLAEYRNLILSLLQAYSEIRPADKQPVPDLRVQSNSLPPSLSAQSHA